MVDTGVTNGSVLPSGRRNHLIAEGSALAAAGIGVLGLLGWLTAWADLARWIDVSVAIAPSTASGLVVLGGAVFLRARYVSRRWARDAVWTAAILLAVFCLLILALVAARLDLGIEGALARDSSTILTAAAGRMSPLTALGLLLAATSLIDQSAFPPGWNTGIRYALGLGALVAAEGLITLAGYALGTPLLYGGSVQPASLPAASGLALLGAALVAAAAPGPGTPGPAPLRRSPRMRYLPIALGVGVGVLLSGVAAVVLGRLEESPRRAAFARTTERAAAALRFAIEQNDDVVQDVRDFFLASREARRDESHAFASAALAHGATVDALAWAPRVTDAERPAFEAAAAREGLRGFRIADLDARNAVVPAARRAEYYPIQWVGVPHGVSGATGFDLASEPARREVLERARDSGGLAASAPIRVRRPGHSFSILMAGAVFRGGTTPGDVAARRDRLAGFVICAFHAAELVATARRGARSPDVALRLTDISDPGHPVALYTDSAFPAPDGGSLPARIPIAVADRTWMAEFRPTASYLMGQRGRNPWLVFAGGVFLTLVVAAHLYSLERYGAGIEIAHQALAQSEGRFRAITESAVDAIITIDASGTVTHCNNAALREFGYDDGSLLGLNVQALISSRYQAAHVAGLAAYRDTGQAPAAGEVRELMAQRRDGTEFPVEMSRSVWETGEGRFATAILRDITDRKRASEEREQLITELQEALANVKTLRGLLPVCAWCRKVLDDRGAWRQMEAYVSEHTEAEFSHGMCPDCEKKFQDGEG